MILRHIRSPLFTSFLGDAPEWYKLTILAFLLLNPVIMVVGGDYGNYLVGWAMVLEFIATLAMALYCYPLQAGGLLVLEAVLLGLTNPEAVYQEIKTNLPVFLLLMYMVAGIYFMKELLLVTFSKILLSVSNRVLMNTVILITSAVLSAFLDALTVVAVLITVTGGFYRAYKQEKNLPILRRYLIGMVMHGSIGTALGGVCTLVGEPQNLLIAEMAGWEFIEFVVYMAPVTMPCLAAGILTCVAVEYYGIAGYGNNLPDDMKREIAKNLAAERPTKAKELAIYNTKLRVQAFCGLLLSLGLVLHLAEVGLIGLTVLVLLTALTGIVKEPELGPAFHEAMPFTALLCCFFVIVAVIHGQHLFAPITQVVQSFPPDAQPAVLFLATGFLSAISDNVFVATIYMGEILNSMEASAISEEQFNLLAVAINTGTNLPSVATPNGQAALLFLLTSSLAPTIGLSYMRMVMMALPYTIVLSITGFLAVAFLL